MIKTTVIIPVYNTKEYLVECIESVFNQTLKEIEVIAINDGSTDESFEMLCKMKEKYPQLTVINQENKGLGATRNIGLYLAKGEYILFLDSDDFILSNTLEDCYREASNHNLDVVMFDAHNFCEIEEISENENKYSNRSKIVKDNNSIFSGKEFWDRYFDKTYEPSACFMFYSKSFLKKNNIFFLPNVYYEDNEFHCKVMALAERIKYIPKMFYQRRCRSGSIMYSEFSEKKIMDLCTVSLEVEKIKNINEAKCSKYIKKIAQLLLQFAVKQHEKILNIDTCKTTWETLFLTGIEICGGDINSINDADIAFMNRICRNMPELLFPTEREYINNRRNEYLYHKLSLIEINNSKKKIAIYGCGKYTDYILDKYLELFGRISPCITFLDSYIKDCSKKYRGKYIRNIDTCELEQFECIYISSQQYESNMMEHLLKYNYCKERIICLFGDLHIEI